jgi:hypothetical protein
VAKRTAQGTSRCVRPEVTTGLPARNSAHQALCSGKGRHFGRQFRQRPSCFRSARHQGEVSEFEDPALVVSRCPAYPLSGSIRLLPPSGQPPATP